MKPWYKYWLIIEVFRYGHGVSDFEVQSPTSDWMSIYPNTTLEAIKAEIDAIEEEKEVRIEAFHQQLP